MYSIIKSEEIKKNVISINFFKSEEIQSYKEKHNTIFFKSEEINLNCYFCFSFLGTIDFLQKQVYALGIDRENYNKKSKTEEQTWKRSWIY